MERFPRSSDIRIWYTYVVDKKQFIDQYRLHVNNRFRPQIEGLISNRDMPIVYDTTKFSNCDFPLLEKDFQKYRLVRQDSLLNLYRTIDSLASIKD